MPLVLPIKLHNTQGGPVTCKVSFYSQGALLTLNGVNGQSKSSNRLDGDIIDVNTDKDLNAPTGTFTITLHNRPIQQEGPFKGQWLQDVIRPLDMVVVSFRRGDRLQGAMVGVVGQIPREQDGLGENQAVQRRVVITGFDLGKLLMNAGIYYFKDVPLAGIKEYALKGYGTLGEKGAFPIGTKASIAKVALETFFYAFSSLSYQRKPPTELTSLEAVDNRDSVRKVLAYKLGKTYGKIPVGLSFFDQEQSVYSFLQNLVEKPWCEVFVETVPDDPNFIAGMVRDVEVGTVSQVEPLDGVKPILFMRETPFEAADWENLPLFEIDDSVVHSYDVGGEPTIYNIFYAEPNGMGVANEIANKAMTGVGLLDPVSAHLHGYRPLVCQSKVFPIGTEGISAVQAVAKFLTERLFRWFAPSAEFLSGTIEVQGNPAYRVGTRLRRKYSQRRNKTIEFYIEGVNHAWQAFGTYRTHLRVTRGLATTANRFPQAPETVDALIYGAEQTYPFRH